MSVGCGVGGGVAPAGVEVVGCGCLAGQGVAVGAGGVGGEADLVEEVLLVVVEGGVAGALQVQLTGPMSRWRLEWGSLSAFRDEEEGGTE